ncbi:MAG: N-6 DNA methylase [Acidimicrobiales bacterium]
MGRSGLGHLSDPLRGLLAELPAHDAAGAAPALLNGLCVALAELSLGVPEVGAPFAAEVDDEIFDLVAPHVVDVIPSQVPWLVVAAHEASLPGEVRHGRGVHATPPEVGIGLCRVLFAHVDRADPPRVVDHSVGAGAFLLAAATVLAEAGVEPDRIVGDLLFGCDVDDTSLSLARWVLAAWALSAGGCVPATASSNLRIGDGLSPGTFAAEAPFDAVVGNPPFLSQLSSTTARSEQERRALSGRFAGAVGGYADTAAAFVAHAVEQVDVGGGIAMIVPESFFATRDAEPVRRRLRSVTAVSAVWAGGRESFAAAVGTCAVIAVRDGAERPVQRLAGPDVRPAGEIAPELLDEPTWSGVLAGMRGVPSVRLTASEATVGDVAEVVAGFRDQYYGLIESVREASEVGGDGAGVVTDRSMASLVTVGMIDPFRLRWGLEEFRFARRRWRQPVVDLDDLADRDPRLSAWYSATLAPKVCVASQTKVIEVAVDAEGTWAATTPVVSAVATDVDVWHLAAALGAPAVTAWSFARAAGSGLSGDAVRVSASLVRSVPLPGDADAWADGAAVLAAIEAGAGPTPGDLAAFAAAMAAAYRCDGDVAHWWTQRLPVR